MRLRSILSFLTLAACSASHGVPDEPDGAVRERADTPQPDAPPADLGAPECDGPRPRCIGSCEGGEVSPRCEAGEWVCGGEDPQDCCGGDAPPGCVCEAGEWMCDTGCPDSLQPFEIDGLPCRGDAVCAEDACGGSYCECRDDVWWCGSVEPDPGCFCGGSEPVAGAPCAIPGQACGECCPRPGQWPVMNCIDGRWEPGICPDIECPTFVEPDCPVDTPAALGTLCSIEGQGCGDACCGTSIVCEGARWRSGPVAECLCLPNSACGGGQCPDGQGCRESLGPDDGTLYRCFHLPEGCRDCSCVVLQAGESCTMVDGNPTISDGGLAG